MIGEAATRKRLIDAALGATGWAPIVPYAPGVAYQNGAVEEYPTDSGPADYVLFKSGQPLAAVEGKRVGIAPQNVLEQAQRYARTIQGTPFQYGEYHLPFAYSTNGIRFFFRDLRRGDSLSRPIARFHTPSALQEMLDRDLEAVKSWLGNHPVDHPRLRPYQRDAIQAIEEALIAGKRRMLVAMATGTGKTFTTIALMYRLLKSGYARRILWLVDRRALAAQAVSEMAAFDAEPGMKFDKVYEVYSQRFHREDVGEGGFDPRVLPTEYLTDPKPGNSFVYVCTIQRMRINLFGRPEEGFPTGEGGEEDAEAERLDIPIHAFDVIVADECHRGYTTTEEGKWREVLDHFDAVRIGLTATPAAHTKAYFQNIVYRYDYPRAVVEGYLVDYDPIIIQSKVRMEGLFLRPGEEVQLIDTTTGQPQYEVLEDERQFDTAQLERLATAPDSNRKIVQEYVKHARAFETLYGHWPKTLVFAINDLQHISHADTLVTVLREECGKGDDFVVKITGNPNVDRPLRRIREFRNRPEPAIAVTVDMLTTGVDIPPIEALLFIRPVKSRILFDQMMGRGTRRCGDIHKDRFLVFDAVGLLQFFRNATDFVREPPDKPTRSFREVIQAIGNNQDRDYNVRILVKRLQRIAKTVSAEGQQEFATFIPRGDMESFARRLPELLKEDLAGTMDLLRNPAFQELLETYPRAPRTFVVAPGTEDVVLSAFEFHTADGRALKPEDYIRAFETFVKERADQIEALAILLDRPRNFNTSVLADLRKKLESTPEGFTEDRLRKAYHMELADIITIIRHAAAGDPLGTTEERIDRALNRIKERKTFTRDQESWLWRIRDHLIRNLLIEREQFSTIPFSRHGGWKKANADFDGKLDELLRAINLAVVT